MTADSRDAASWTIVGSVLRVTSTSARDSIIEAIRASCLDPGFSTGLDLLIDARELAHAPEQLSAPLVHERALEIGALGFRRCATVVADAQPAQFGLANMFATYADQAGVEASVFRKIEEAESWLTPREP